VRLIEPTLYTGTDVALRVAANCDVTARRVFAGVERCGDGAAERLGRYFIGPKVYTWLRITRGVGCSTPERRRLRLYYLYAYYTGSAVQMVASTTAPTATYDTAFEAGFNRMIRTLRRGDLQQFLWRHQQVRSKRRNVFVCNASSGTVVTFAT